MFKITAEEKRFILRRRKTRGAKNERTVDFIFRDDTGTETLKDILKGYSKEKKSYGEKENQKIAETMYKKYDDLSEYFNNGDIPESGMVKWIVSQGFSQKAAIKFAKEFYRYYGD